MTIFRISIAVALLFLAACAQQPARKDSGPADDAQRRPKVVVAKPAPGRPPLPNVELTEELMFKVMLAEIALQRGQPHVAVPAYLELARETRDPRIAQRATEIAWNARFVPAALEAVSIWLQADPESARARQIMAALLINQSQLQDARPHLEKWLASQKADAGEAFLQLSSLLARHQDKKAVARLMEALAGPYPDVPEARLALAQAAWQADEQALSLSESQAALRLRPGWELAALFEAQVLQRRSNAEALAYFERFLERYPDAKDVRLNYARLLITERRYADARKQFEMLIAAHVENADMVMTVAALAVQMRDYEAAETHLKRVLELDYKDQDAVRLQLGQVNEERKRYDEALKWYAAVGRGPHYINAQGRYAGVLAKQGSLADARRHLQGVSPQNPQQRVQLIQAEAQLLREAGAYQEAFDLLGGALEKLPDNAELLYDQAMAAEKVDRLDIAEGNLRKLIKLRPDHAHAYNALGYTLADRNVRLTEARTLIETAHKLAPDDPFILDSLGWVMFRLGDLKQAVSYLERAFAQRPDAEIAAHLGEVLWAQGERARAQKIWSEALKEHPESDILRDTIKRFLPEQAVAQ